MSLEVLRLLKVRATLEPAFREQLMKSPLKFLQEYDLTEEEKRQIILPNFSWLFEHKLAAMAYPPTPPLLRPVSPAPLLVNRAARPGKPLLGM